MLIRILYAVFGMIPCTLFAAMFLKEYLPKVLSITGHYMELMSAILILGIVGMFLLLRITLSGNLKLLMWVLLPPAAIILVTFFPYPTHTVSGDIVRFILMVPPLSMSMWCFIRVVRPSFARLPLLFKETKSLSDERYPGY